MATFIQGLTKIGSDVRSNIGPLDSSCKVFTNSVKAVKAISSDLVPIPVGNASEQFTTFSGVVSALNIGNRFYEWLSPKARETWSWQKYSAQAFLTAANVSETVLWGNKIGFWALGAAAPGLDIFQKVVLMPVSFFNIWNSANEIGKADKTLKTYTARHAKWQGRAAEIATDSRAFVEKNIPEILRRIKDKKDAEIAFKQAEELKTKAPLSGDVATKHAERLTKFKAQKTQWNEISQLYRDAEFYSENPLTQDAEVYNENPLAEVFNRKLNGYAEVVKAATHNKGKIQTKNWLTIANCVMKLVLGAIGFALLITGIAVPWVLAAVAASWAATHLLALSKELYEIREENKPKNLFPLIPKHLQAAIV